MVKGSPRVSSGGGGSGASGGGSGSGGGGSHGVSALRPARGQQTVSSATAHFKKKASKGQAALAATIEQSRLEAEMDKDEIYERFMCIRLPKNERLTTEDGRRILSFSLENQALPLDEEKLRKYLKAFQYGIHAIKTGEGIPCPPKDTEAKSTRARNRGNRDSQSLRDAAKQREKKHIKQKRILQMKRAMEELKRMKDHQSSVQEEVSKLDSKLAELRPKIEQLHEQKKAIVLQVKSVCQ